MSNIRPSALAGTWYPGNAAQLSRSVDSFIQDAMIAPVPGALVGVIAPHAGHRYSGNVAGHAFKAMQSVESVDTIAVIGPMHHSYPHRLLTTVHDAYQTPLGDVPVDHDTLKAIQENCKIPVTAIAKDPEHSLEIELPFLQRLFNSFKLIPIMIRDDSVDVCAALGEALAMVLRERRSLLVASSDLSHFYPQSAAQKLDAYMLAQIESFDPLAVLKAEDEGKGYACGRGAIATVLTAARRLGTMGVQVVKHATSGDVTGDYGSVVGYGAAVIWK